MKIGYIGGFKDGKTTEIFFERHKTIGPNWIVEHEDSKKKFQVMHNRLNSNFGKPINEDESIVYYNLMMVRKNGETKYFYVIKNASKDEIELGVNSHWDKSSTIGYDF